MVTSQVDSLRADPVKSGGVHYTPARLAQFLAERIAITVGDRRPPLRVLDPACGDGGLLEAMAEALPEDHRTKAEFIGYEMDADAVQATRTRLSNLGLANVDIRLGDFLDGSCGESEMLFESNGDETFDVVISNPPYVRTQVLGSKEAQRLARRYGLTGRVDLYHAFTIAMTQALRSGGVLGLLTSNRFLMIQSGASMRRLLRDSYEIHEIFDLGDTKLFEAAVLPAIVVATREPAPSSETVRFSRVYEVRSDQPSADATESPLDAITTGASRIVEFEGTRYQVDRGWLEASDDAKLPWTSLSDECRLWLSTVAEHSAGVFDDVAKIRVGVKTTADAVFIRNDWGDLPASTQPEAELLYPLITHHLDVRWRLADTSAIEKRILYPHAEASERKKHAVAIEEYPHALAYLEAHRERLEGRQYVIDSGRNWWEIWVPQRPEDWRKRKLICPDISEQPRFFVDETGSIVNGDCYWITLKPGQPEHALDVMLGIANSTFISRFYDIKFHNKLYAGRRRFMTQYVKQFPIPDLGSDGANELAGLVRQQSGDQNINNDVLIDRLVWQLFGLGQA